MELDPRLHFLVATAIIVRDGKFLIAKRAGNEKAYPNMWTVPGGKLVLSEYKDLPKTTGDAWYNIMEWVLRKEVREEVGLEVETPRFLADLAFVRPDGYPVVTLSYWCHYRSGEVVLDSALTEYAWVTAEEAKDYELIEGIRGELETVEALLKNA